jgi:hypothetical protein
MKQPRIPVLEDVNYSSWSISTLRRFAQAFDLRLRVSFEEFGTLINDYETLEQKSLERRSFDEDPVFKESSELEINMIDATLPQMAQTVHPVEKDIMGNQRTIERFPSLMAPQNVPQHRPGRSYGIYNDSTSQNDSLLSKRAA